MLLQEPSRPHEISDDIESFLLVLTWVALLYTPHTLSVSGLRGALSMFDQQEIKQDDNGWQIYRSGGSKLWWFTRPSFSACASLKNGKTLGKLITNLKQVISLRYLDPEIPIAERTSSLELLSDEKWFVQLLERSLDEDPWPAQPDPSCRNFVCGDVGLEAQNKRKRHGAILETRVHTTSSAKGR